MSFLEEEFKLKEETKNHLFSLSPQFGFNQLGYVVFLRTYSRVKADGNPESWADVVIRVTEGIFSIRKNHFIKNRLSWNDDDWQDYAKGFSESMFNMFWLPPGRGLWACGTDIVKLKGSGALNNCGAVSLFDLVKGATWTMDFLMMGCGVGFDTKWEGKNIVRPDKTKPTNFEVPDSREGWVESLKLLLNSYVKDGKGNIGEWYKFNYSKLRPKGTPLKIFGGTSSGPDPLIKLHKRVEAYLDAYCDYLDNKDSEIIFSNLIDKLKNVDYDYMSNEEFNKLKNNVIKSATENPKTKIYNSIRLQVDIQNAIGACVVAGNIRRSSELALGNAGDEVFLNLKNYKINPERQAIGWMSNNTVRLNTKDDFSLIPTIAERIKDNGEPGIYNQLNVERYGRVGHYHDSNDESTRETEKDHATLCNPCITRDSLILTKEGWKQVKDLVGKPFVAVVNGKEYPSTEKGFWSNGIKQVYKLTLKNGMNVKLTDNHKLTTITRGKNKKLVMEDTMLKDMKIDDKIVVCNNTGYSWPEGTKEEFNEGYFCGQLVGNGTFSDTKQGESIPSICLWIDKKYNNLYDYQPYKQIQGWCVTFKGRSDFKGFRVEAEKEKYIKYTMRKKCFKEITDKYGIYALEKKVPENNTYQFEKGFIMGFFDSDGTVVGNHSTGISIRLCQVDIRRLEAVQRILHKYGIFARIYKDRKLARKEILPDGHEGHTEYNCQPIHELIISSDSIIIFMKLFGFMDNDKKAKIEKLISQYQKPRKGQRFAKITSIEKLNEEEVFDCTIPVIHHFDFCGLLSHNCCEIGLESGELCNLSEIFPYRIIFDDKESKYGHISSKSEKLFIKAIEFATFYSSTVSLLPTHCPETNAVIGRNRRIGVSLSSIADVYDIIGFTELTRLCRLGYRKVREINTKLAKEACVPASLRVTCTKPSGSLSQLVGVSSGMHFPTFKYSIRRVRISDISPLVPILKEAGYKCEKDVYSDNTLVIEFPIDQGKTRNAEMVSIWEQFSLLSMLQREWTDNMVSVTIYFSKAEINQIEYALAQYAPVIKSCSMLPHTEKGVYRQAPYEGISKEKYEELLSTIKPVDWKAYCNPQEPEAPKYCSNDACELPAK